MDAVHVLLLHQGVAGELPDDVLGGDQEGGVAGVHAVQGELDAPVHGQRVGIPGVGDGAAGEGGAVGLAGLVGAQAGGGEGGDLHRLAAGEADLARLGDHPRGGGRGGELLVDELLIGLCVIKRHRKNLLLDAPPCLGGGAARGRVLFSV